MYLSEALLLDKYLGIPIRVAAPHHVSAIRRVHGAHSGSVCKRCRLTSTIAASAAGIGIVAGGGAAELLAICGSFALGF